MEAAIALKEPNQEPILTHHLATPMHVAAAKEYMEVLRSAHAMAILQGHSGSVVHVAHTHMHARTHARTHVHTYTMSSLVHLHIFPCV